MELERKAQMESLAELKQIEAANLKREKDKREREEKKRAAAEVKRAREKERDAVERDRPPRQKENVPPPIGAQGARGHQDIEGRLMAEYEPLHHGESNANQFGVEAGPGGEGEVHAGGLPNLRLSTPVAQRLAFPGLSGTAAGEGGHEDGERDGAHGGPISMSEMEAAAMGGMSLGPSMAGSALQKTEKGNQQVVGQRRKKQSLPAAERLVGPYKWDLRGQSPAPLLPNVMVRHCLCPVFPLPSCLRHCLSLWTRWTSVRTACITRL